MKNTALIVAGTVFFVVGVMHGVRLAYKAEIKIAGRRLPLWLSVGGLIGGLGLAAWMFMSVR